MRLVRGNSASGTVEIRALGRGGGRDVGVRVMPSGLTMNPKRKDLTLTTDKPRVNVPAMYALDDMLTLQDVASYLKLHINTVYSLSRKRILPMRRVGRQWRIRFDTLTQWVEQGGGEGNGSEHRRTRRSPRRRSDAAQ